jgi:type IV secretion system protein VirD4
MDMREKIRIGYWDKTCRTPLYYPHDSHLILTAPAGSGKGRDILIPSLLSYKGSVVCIDPKGQLAAVTGNFRAQRLRQRVFVLNPFKILQSSFRGLSHAGFNPLAVLDPRAAAFGADCDSLAEAICYHDRAGSDAEYWTDSARQLISGGIMALASLCPPRDRNLVKLFEIIGGPDSYKFAAWAFRNGDIHLRGRLGRFLVPHPEESKELSGIVNTARTAMNFIGNDAIAESLYPTGAELRFSDLRTKPTTVYLVLPTRYLATCAKWFRLVIAAAMADLLQEERGPVPVLALMDEFAQLGTLKVMSDVMGIGRGYGLQLWPVLQDLNQLEELYPHRWQTFLSNAGAQLFFAPRDLKTANYVSEKCGDYQEKVPSYSVNENAWGPKETVDNISVTTSYSPTPIRYLKPHQVAEIGGDEMLVFAENIAGVIHAGRRSYLKSPECRGFSQDPYHERKSWLSF